MISSHKLDKLNYSENVAKFLGDLANFSLGWSHSQALSISNLCQKNLAMMTYTCTY